jgi:hypothetical protein
LASLGALSAANASGAVNQTHAKANAIQRHIMSETIFSILRNGVELGKQSLAESLACGRLHIHEQASAFARRGVVEVVFRAQGPQPKLDVSPGKHVLSNVEGTQSRKVELIVISTPSAGSG